VENQEIKSRKPFLCKQRSPAEKPLPGISGAFNINAKSPEVQEVAAATSAPKDTIGFRSFSVQDAFPSAVQFWGDEHE
jgi:hypothetical protein